ncbi:MAG: dTDP-4-dehydrorhamnose reductase [Alphaproteobacteria bacterium]|nr:dTDP-4-dehydrorhamnose reductase [Alphaproteobacteria bacterium]
MTSRPIAVIGASGQVAQALIRLADQSDRPLVARGRPDVDLTDIATVGRFFDEVRPSVIVNAAAHTAVDKAESEPEAAFALNAEGPAKLAVVCNAMSVPLIHLSTDYVFNGLAQSPYRATDEPSPMSVYGASKAAGEMAVAVGCPQHIILRTAWVYGVEGNNFVKTMLRLGAERDELGIVADQRGSPTFADDIASAILSIAQSIISEPNPDRWGIYHYTNAGETTWHEFAQAIFAHARSAGRNTPNTVKPIATADYPTPARRPPYSVLDCGRVDSAFQISRPDWKDALARAMPEILKTF